MWQNYFSLGVFNYIEINFPEKVVISEIKIWNYNEHLNQTSKGVQLFNIIADGENLTPKQGVLLRKAPGIDTFDFSQTISLPFQSGWTLEQIDNINKHYDIPRELYQEYETPNFPRGMFLKFVL